MHDGIAADLWVEHMTGALPSILCCCIIPACDVGTASTGGQAALPDSQRVQLAVGEATAAERPGKAAGRHPAGRSAVERR